MSKLRVVPVLPIANDEQNERNDDEQEDIGPVAANDDDDDDDDDDDARRRQPRRKHSEICQAGTQQKLSILYEVYLTYCIYSIL